MCEEESFYSGFDRSIPAGCLPFERRLPIDLWMPNIKKLALSPGLYGQMQSIAAMRKAGCCGWRTNDNGVENMDL